MTSVFVMTQMTQSYDSNLDKQVLNTDVVFTNFLVQHNIALLTGYHLTLLFKEAFPDSKIAKRYASLRKKTTNRQILCTTLLRLYCGTLLIPSGLSWYR